MRSKAAATAAATLITVVAFTLATSASAQSLSLHEAIESALRSPQAQALDAQTDEAKSLVHQAGLGPNPRLTLQSEDWRPWGENFDFGSQTENYAFVGQIFETDGKRHKRVVLARAHLAQAEAESRAARFGIVGRVAAAYFNAVVLQRVAVLLEEDMHTVDAMVRYDQNRVDQGAMRGVDLLRTKIERDRLLLALRAAERDTAQAQLELFKQIGRSADPASLKLTDTVDSFTPVPPVPLEQVLASRPDLVSLRAAVQSAQADLALQRSIRVPNIDVVAGYKRNNSYNTGYSSMQMELPFRNRNQGEIERAEASARYAASALAAAEARARVEVAQAEENYKREREIVEQVLPDMRANAQQNLRLLTEAYRIGGLDLLRFIDAERTALDTEVAALRTLADLRQSAIHLQLMYGEQP